MHQLQGWNHESQKFSDQILQHTSNEDIPKTILIFIRAWLDYSETSVWKLHDSG